MKHSYDEFICRTYRKSFDDFLHDYRMKKISKIIEQRRANRAIQQYTTTDAQVIEEDDNDTDQIPSKEDSSSDADTGDDFIPNNDRESTKLLRESLDHLLSLCGNRNRTWITHNYRKLTGQVRLNYLSCTRSIIRTVMSIMVPYEVDELEGDLFEYHHNQKVIKLDNHFLSVTEGVSEAYKNAESWTTRREVLSIIAPQIDSKLIQSFLSGITLCYFTAARKYAAEFGHGAAIEQSPTVIHRFDYDQVEHFIDFITSEHVCTDLPLGERSLKQSNGKELFVPNTIRNMIPPRIIQQYYLSCQENSFGFRPLGRSSLYSLLDVCKASTRKSLQGINYFAADAGEAFDSIGKLIDELHLDMARHRRPLENLKRSKQYLKSDYKVYVTKSSTVADHCATFALSDKYSKEFRQLCDHEHNGTCDDSLSLQVTFDEIIHAINSSNYDKQLSARLLAKLNHIKRQ